MPDVQPHACDLLLIEDDAPLAAALMDELSREGYRCRWVATGEAGLDAIRQDPPTLVLLDLNLPGRSGLEVLAYLRQQSFEPPVIVLTARLQGRDKVEALDLGADDYVTKPFWTDEVCARIRAVLRRRKPQRPRRKFIAGPLTVDLDTGHVHLERQRIHLTPTELDLLVYLLRRPRRVAMREHLIDSALPGEASDIESLQVHMSRLRRKLGASGGLIVTVRGLGYRLDGDVRVIR